MIDDGAGGPALGGAPFGLDTHRRVRLHQLSAQLRAEGQAFAALAGQQAQGEGQGGGARPVAAVQAADLAGVLQGEGPFTVFAPVDAAFQRLPAGTVETLLQPENQGQLQAVLTYHVVPGNLTREALWEAVLARDGAASFETVQGERLTVMRNGNNLKVMDRNGNSANLTVVDVAQANGVIHVIDRVLLP